MNFNQSNLFGDCLVKNFLPYLNNLIPPCSVHTYFELLDRKENAYDNYNHMNLYYFPEGESFVKDLKDKCVYFFSPKEPESGFLNMMYQINRNTHVYTALFLRGKDKIGANYTGLYSFLNVTVSFKDIKDYNKVYEDFYKYRIEKDYTECNNNGGGGLGFR